VIGYVTLLVTNVNISVTLISVVMPGLVPGMTMKNGKALPWNREAGTSPAMTTQSKLLAPI
jgi:hypothetical protein